MIETRTTEEQRLRAASVRRRRRRHRELIRAASVVCSLAAIRDADVGLHGDAVKL